MFDQDMVSESDTNGYNESDTNRATSRPWKVRLASHCIRIKY